MAEQIISYEADVGAAVIDALIAAHLLVSAPLQSVYDHSLEYQTAIGKFRSKEGLLGTTAAPANPLLIYNRSVLKPTHHYGKRLACFKAMGPVDVNGNFPLYKMNQGMFDLTFMFTSPSAKEIEAFEIAYNAATGIRTVRHILFPMPNISGNWTYVLEWGDPETLDIQSGDVYRKGVASAVNVRGWFLVGTPDTETIINKIQFTAQSKPSGGQIFANKTLQ